MGMHNKGNRYARWWYFRPDLDQSRMSNERNDVIDMDMMGPGPNAAYPRLNRRLREIRGEDSELLTGGWIGLLICIVSMIAWYTLKAYRRRQRVNALVAQFREILMKERTGRFQAVRRDEAAYWV